MNTAERKSLKASDFALPKERAYPIHTASHARDALSRVDQYGTPEEKTKVRAAVKKRHPGITQSKPMTPNETPAKKPDASEMGSG